ncbi:MAG: 5-(carboxyamino)imidazole ribonucleotide synthase [Polyangiales bacterium]
MRIGCIGGGQLGRMLSLAGQPLGHTFVVLEPVGDACAASVADVIAAPYDDEDALRRLASVVDVVTCEFESVPERALLRTADLGAPVRPGPEAFRTASDRLLEKTMFNELGIPTAPFRRVDDHASLEVAVRELGLPCVLKTRRLGYDGKGQRVLRSEDDVRGAFEALGSVPMILEGWVPFRRELSIVAARGLRGDMAFYPLVENIHRDGILCRTTAPAPNVAPELTARAESYAAKVMQALDYVGVLAIELFDADVLRVNEMAPRVHNSGHFSIDGAVTSQFENHVRAIAGSPLGPTELRGTSVMFNLVGGIPDPDAVLAIPGAHLHLYGKDPKPGRKVGHLTVVDEGIDDFDGRIARAEALSAAAWRGANGG